MPTNRLLLLVLLILALSPAARAANTPPPPDDCASKNTQFEMNGCAELARKKVDAALSKTYQALQKKLTDPDAKALLKDAERAWVVYRDKQCEFESSGVKGGSVEPMVRAMCLQGLTEKRTKELARQVTCQEGDVSCAR